MKLVPGDDCVSCGLALPPDAPAGLCPPWLLEQASGEKTNGASGARFVPPSPEILSDCFPDFEIEKLIGSGGMGAVYRIRHSGKNNLEALKILPPELDEDPTFSARFLREAKTLEGLSHPNIVEFHDSGKQGDYYFILMEYIEGIDLSEVISHGPMSPREIQDIVLQLCSALEHAHDKGVVHRDVKPGNILLTPEGKTYLSDFGLAKVVRAGQSELSITLTNTTTGTPVYMPPEQLDGEEADHRADLYDSESCSINFLPGNYLMENRRTGKYSGRFHFRNDGR